MISLLNTLFYFIKSSIKRCSAEAMLYNDANIFSFCVCVCICVHDPSFSIMLISVLPLFFPSFLISPSENIPFSPLFLLASLFFCFFLSLTNHHSLENVGDCFNVRYSIRTSLQWWGVCGTKRLLFTECGDDLRILLNLCLTTPLHELCAEATPPSNGVLSYPVCCVDCKSFDRSWCSCLKSAPIPELDPDLNPPQNLSFPETSLSSAPI